VIGHFSCERRINELRLRVSGVARGDRYEILAFRRLDNHDVIVLVKEPGASVWAELGRTRYAPTTFEIVRLKPINIDKQGGFGRPGPALCELPRENRPAFVGWYRIEETIARVEPGRKRKIVDELRARVDAWPGGGA
jgi:hypothetical protein